MRGTAFLAGASCCRWRAPDQPKSVPVSGLGLVSDERPAFFNCSDPVLIDAQLRVPRTAEVSEGTSISGELTLNNTGPEILAGLRISDIPPDIQLQLDDGGEFTVPSGNSSRVFSISLVGRPSSVKHTLDKISLVTSEDAELAVAYAELEITEPPTPPSWWDRWRFVLLGAAALLLIAVVLAVVRKRAAEKRQSVTGLQAAVLPASAEPDALSWIRG